MLGVSVQWCWDKHTDKACNLHCLFSSSVPCRNWPWLWHTQISIAVVRLGLGWMETKLEVCFEHVKGMVFFFFACTSSEVHKITHWSFPAEPQRFRSETFSVTVCVNNANKACFLEPFAWIHTQLLFLESRWTFSLNLWHFRWSFSYKSLGKNQYDNV